MFTTNRELQNKVISYTLASILFSSEVVSVCVITVELLPSRPACTLQVSKWDASHCANSTTHRLPAAMKLQSTTKQLAKRMLKYTKPHSVLLHVKQEPQKLPCLQLQPVSICTRLHPTKEIVEVHCRCAFNHRRMHSSVMHAASGSRLAHCPSTLSFLPSRRLNARTNGTHALVKRRLENCP